MKDGDLNDLGIINKYIYIHIYVYIYIYSTYKHAFTMNIRMPYIFTCNATSDI